MCGIYRPYTDDPGVVFEENIPGPIAPVVEGQDQPAAPGEGEDPGTVRVITGGTSNDAGANDSRSENDSDPEERPVPAPAPRPEPVPSPETPEEDEDDTGICWPWESDC